MKDMEWVIFDLDDTLHDFSSASSAAMMAVYEYLYEEFGIYPEDASKAYRDILKEGQSGHFIEDKPSRSYRQGRFENLLDQFSILPHMHLDRCLDIYDDALCDALTLKEGAPEIIKLCKSLELKIMVVSEGPYDAQELTLERLGLSEFIDALYTSSKVGLHKGNGLYEYAIKQQGADKQACVIIGDNPDRDILPAQKAGIPSILVGDKDAPENTPSVGSLTVITQYLKRAAIGQFPIPSRDLRRA